MTSHPSVQPVRFEPAGLAFTRYPFRAAHVWRDGQLAREEIVDVDPTHPPPAVRTRAGELLFVPATQRAELVAWACAHAVPLVAREDVWMWLLEPFLDVETGPVERAREYEALAAHGLAPAEVDALRRRVAGPMEAYVGLTWEWVHLGLWDVLFATTSRFTSWTWRRADREAFYHEAMAIALRGAARPLAEDPA